MVQRSKDKVKRPLQATGDSTDLEARVRALEAERDALRAELEQARGRIAALEESRTQVASRIEWVIDSLHNIGDGSD